MRELRVKNRRETVGSQFFCRETSRCLAGPSGFQQIRDAEMTVKIIFERSSQKGRRQGVRKEGEQGTHLEILLSA